MPGRDRQRAVVGTVSLQLLVILVPVLFGFMGFAVDLGRLYLIRGELNQAAEAMALAAASKLIGTDASLAEASAAASLTLDAAGHGNKYNFGILTIGEAADTLTSEASAPVPYATAAEAIGEATAAGEPATGAAAKHLRATVRADAPLLFWSLLSLGQERKVSITAAAAAGVSAPLCTACGIEPFAIQAVDAADPVDFGFDPTRTTRYTFVYSCTGPPPAPLPGTSMTISYLIIDRYNDTSTQDESQQLFRVGAQGLLPSPEPARGCAKVNDPAGEKAWVTASPGRCGVVTSSVTGVLCGLASRFESALPDTCLNMGITDVESLAAAYPPDRDASDVADYAAYTGDTRRVITVAVVDLLNAAGPMIVQGFRQFLLEPNQGGTNILPGDQNGRFTALYIGNPMPLKQGRFDGGCNLSTGPGKVVLHR